MKPFFILATISTLLLSACSNLPARLDNTPEPAENDPTPTVQTAISTPTLTPVGTWETVIRGLIYDQSAGPDKPIAGATIIYDVLHTYYPELQEGRLNKTVSDEQGMFSLTVMVHDTDSIRVAIEATGYTTYEEKCAGFDLLAGKSLEVGLSPEQYQSLCRPSPCFSITD